MIFKWKISCNIRELFHVLAIPFWAVVFSLFKTAVSVISGWKQEILYFDMNSIWRSHYVRMAVCYIKRWWLLLFYQEYMEYKWHLPSLSLTIMLCGKIGWEMLTGPKSSCKLRKYLNPGLLGLMRTPYHTRGAFTPNSNSSPESFPVRL